MTDAPIIQVRPAGWSDRDRLQEFLRWAGGPDGAAFLPLSRAAVRNYVLATDGEAVAGACQIIPGAGRCAAVLAPQLPQWDNALAARLCRAAAALAHGRHGARLIQALTEPDGAGPLAAALEHAGFERLAVLAYLRRQVEPQEQAAPLPAAIQWRSYGFLRHRQFAETIERTYRDTCDCPRLAGLRTVHDAVATHKRTGIFCPSAWQLAMIDGRPAGVSLVNNLQGRGDLVYLGVAPEYRRQGIGRALVARAVRGTAAMGLSALGLAVDVANTAAMRLYEKTGFKEVRRRLAYFVPREGLEALAVDAGALPRPTCL
jgi:GNAT superfamily N-acetyltransferase